MTKLVECIPNFSEGRNKDTINKLVDICEASKGITLLDYSADKNHNRSVFTIIGSPENMEKALVELCKVAIENIDMNKHKGEHPRMGAIDVIPLVPIKNITMEECIELSKIISKKIYDELKLPVFLYEESSNKLYRKNLADIRKGQFEKMSKKLLLDEWNPDFGKREIHLTAGVVAVGARMPLIAFNINLDTNDLNIAKNIAKAVRGSSGGYKYCKAIGVMLEDKNIAQVSMNMVNYEKTPLHRVFETVKLEALKYGVNIVESEIIGLTPYNALVNSAIHYLQLNNFNSKTQILENHIFE